MKIKNVLIVIKFLLLGNEYPKVEDNYKQIITPQTAYQVTSILQGAVERGTGKKLKNLN